MTDIRKANAAIKRAYTLIDFSIYNDVHKQYEFKRQAILVDDSLIENEKSEAIRILTANYDESKIIYNEGIKRISEWVNGSYDEWDFKEQRLKRYGEHLVVLKRLENIENANQSWFEEAKSHLTISNRCPEIVQCYGLTQDPSNGSYMLSKSNQSEENNVSSLENYTSTSKLYQFGTFPEPRNATEEELEAFYSKPFNSYIPDNNEDEVYNNPNLHSEDQDKLEISDN
ncbi:kinase-like domain-containing protein [Rhizophagus irregularis DAOM 181602=DAOM 197198]|nr:kinase-like domain-containing protein [Rhizophagus irregularis DAOM 181602=DAOM 197198]